MPTNRCGLTNQIETLSGNISAATYFDSNWNNPVTALNDASLGYINAIQTDSGSANNYVVSCIYGVPSALNQGMFIGFIPANANTAGSNLTVNSLAATPITDINGNALAAGAIQSGRFTPCIYIGSSFRIISPAPTGGVAYTYDYDDFIGGAPKFLVGSATGGSSSITYPTYLSGHPGNWELSSAAGGGYSYLASTAGTFLDTFTWTIRATIIPIALGTSSYYVFGLLNSTGLAVLPNQNRINFYAVTGTANWQCSTANGTATTVDSGVAFTVNTAYVLEIVASSSRAVFSINGNVVATLTTTIPLSTTQIPQSIYVLANGTISQMLVDTYEVLVTGFTSPNRFLYAPT